jgi:hypothetical protein
MRPPLHPPGAAGPIEVRDLLRMSPRELDALFTNSPAGTIPDGEGDGTLIIASGSPLASVAAAIGRLAWRGKVFDARRGRLMNRLTPFGVKAVAAEVYTAPSRFDGKDCIVLDYARTSRFAHRVRDEMREIAPRLYLGKAFLQGRPLLHFVLRFEAGHRDRGMAATPRRRA